MLIIRRLFFTVICCVFTINVATSSISLSELMVKYRTDKGVGDGKTWGHHYDTYYERYFAPLREKPIKLLEIGFASGASAKVWEEYFPQAELYFIDIDKSCFEKNGKNLSPRSHLCLVDQGSETALNKFIEEVGGNFDIIIDDGGHQMHQQITSFKALFPHIKSGGIYVVEDLHTSYWYYYGGTGSPRKPLSNDRTMTRFLQLLIDDVNFVGAATECADHTKCPKNLYDKLSYYQKHIESMHFYDSLCFVFKA